MAVFHLVRHGEALHQVADERQLTGAARDWVPLSEAGVFQAQAAAKQLQGAGLTALLSSPLTRALQTAGWIARALDLDVQVELDLHEWLADTKFQDNSMAVFHTRLTQMLAKGDEPPGERNYDWEPLSNVRRRVQTVLNAYRHHERVGVVTHGVVIYSLTGAFVAYGSVTEYRLP